MAKRSFELSFRGQKGDIRSLLVIFVAFLPKPLCTSAINRVLSLGQYDQSVMSSRIVSQSQDTCQSQNTCQNRETCQTHECVKRGAYQSRDTCRSQDTCRSERRMRNKSLSRIDAFDPYDASLKELQTEVKNNL